MKKALFTSIIFLLLVIMCFQAYASDIELVLYKGFLQNLINNIFPLTFSEKFTPDIQLSKGSDVLSFEYQIIINKPVLSIEPEYIQLDATIDWVSLLGKQSSPGKFKFVPVFNPENNNVEFNVIEGKFRLKINLGENAMDLGEIDISKYLSDVKIPLEFKNIKVTDKKITTKFENVNFKLLNDRVVVNSEVVINKEAEKAE